MKFSHQWLSNYLDESPTVSVLKEKLTTAGLEVDSIEAVAPPFSGVVVAEIKSIEKHRAADKLNICQVDIGEDELLTIVCGAGNVYAGMKAPLAKIGARLPGDFKIKKSELRGQESFGMLCSEKELGISEESEGLMDLPIDAPIGIDIRQYLQLDDDVIEVDLTPNRADCLSVYGIAREVSALTSSKLIKLPVVELQATQKASKTIISQASTLCPRYFGRMIKSVNTKATTPLWMKERLRRSGLRSISVIVDITNYVLLELGQPMHAFDADKLTGSVYTRMAKEGEKIILLDETEVTLKSNTLVIADDNKVLAIAGVMGGLYSSVTENSKTIFLESAYFTPEAIAGKARQYGLHTDSSHRFERGVDPNLCAYAIDYATYLILDIAGGEIEDLAVADHYVDENKIITLRLSKINSILGMNFETSYVEQILQSLNISINKLSQDANETLWQVIPPSYRFDIAIEEDLIEEVGRIYGYQNLPMSLPEVSLIQQQVSEQVVALNRLKIVLVDRGYHEVVNYSFIDPKLDALFFNQAGLTLQNPISQDMSVMRQGLIPGLVSTFKFNLNRQQSRIRIFEEGVCFQPAEQLAHEYLHFAGLAYGNINPLNWQETTLADFYSVKADVEALLQLNKKSINYVTCEDIDWLHPGQSAYIYQNGEQVGVIGILHPNIMKVMQIKGKSPVVFELQTSKISNRDIAKFMAISKYPAVSRDIAVIVDRNTTAQRLIDAVNKANVSHLNQVDLFDIYQGESLPEDKKSVALNLIFQDNTQTLTDEMMNEAITKILTSLKTHVDASLRE
ncbi:phenylalanine--tRNA ligase subunit beta [Fastidiosibacter lacustris]|uniref:phenylalanine--tRNA ligase subunit beta n=1 Tax=Fastidiosibacter lacustris TaxID=2056695 RepID=UPI000E34BCC5|nr:phenylalanine--tRNA ligase subunit beta [Fastidiosibacter lacustris]